MKARPHILKSKISKSTATTLIIVGCIALVWVVRLITLGPNAPQKIIVNRTKGSSKAPIHIVEYLDYQCPACARGAATLKQYLQKFPAKIYLEVRYFPIIKIHEHAMRSALYVECAAEQNKFWEFQNLVLERQSQWAKLINADPAFKDIAQEIKLDLGKLEACANDDKTRAVIFDEKAAGRALGVDSTPSYFINGKMVVGPKPLAEELDKYLGGKNN